MPRVTPGNYVPLDVNYPHDAAIRRAGDAAELLFIRSLAYAKRTRNGGFVPSYDLEVIGVGLRNLQRRVAALVAERLWVETPGGWEIRSWARWNGTDDARSQASHLGNHTRWHVNEGKPDPDCELCRASPPTPARDSDGTPNGNPHPISDGDIAREGKGREGKKTSSSAAADGAFDDFWQQYPRKIGKQAARKVWDRKTRNTDPAEITEGLARWVDYWQSKGTEPEFIPHPSTWLQRGSWEDEVQAEEPTDVSPLWQGAFG